jgi:predicted Zn-dependent protease
LRKYNVASDGGTVPFATTGIPVVVPSSLQSYWQAVTDACNFWNKYVPLLHLYPVGSTNSEYFIEILDHTDQTSNYVAETFRTYTASHQVAEAYIKIYKGWLGYPDILKVDVLSHELGHALLTEQHIDEYGLWFVMSTWGGNAVRLLPCIAQKATRLLYEHAPGWKP